MLKTCSKLSGKLGKKSIELKRSISSIETTKLYKGALVPLWGIRKAIALIWGVE